jgi:hypothetical protein
VTVDFALAFAQMENELQEEAMERERNKRQR